jgi:diguanylate cyclase (GGDEF)-like protein
MTSLYSSINERVVNKMPESMAALKMGDDASSYKGMERVLSTTAALLNQTQSELDASRLQIESLKKQLAELEMVATTDTLTGLKNRRGFDDHFARELDRTRRGKSIGGVLVVIDLDSFKAINDTYGHQAGDACLQLVAKVLAEEIRVMDTASRIGGDEFVLLMTDSTQELLLTRVQNIAWKLNHLILPWNSTSIAINASVGMKPYHKGDTAEGVFSEADQSMYLDKKRSRTFAV